MTSIDCDSIFNATATEALLPYAKLIDAIEVAVGEYGQGKIRSPERLATPLLDGGVMLSMPSVAADIAIHKLVNVCPANRSLQLPTISGQVTAYDPATGRALFQLDGPTVTARRTAAITVFGIKSLHTSAPKEVLIIGTGKQAANHVEALTATYPQAKLWVKGKSVEDALVFCGKNSRIARQLSALKEGPLPDSIDVVITLTTSSVPVYNETARAGRLVVGVGAFTPQAAEVGRNTVQGSYIVVDDFSGARHEAGDLIQSDVNWLDVHPLSVVLADPHRLKTPIFFKSVGCAAWDLAACRTARMALSGQSAPIKQPHTSSPLPFNL